MKIAYLVLMQLFFSCVVYNDLQSISHIVYDNDVLVSGGKGSLQVSKKIQAREEIELNTPGLVSFLYSNPVGKLIAPLCTRSAFASNIAGWYADSNTSRKNIKKFIRAYHINTAEIGKEISEYKTLNDFFIRKLKAGSRVFDVSHDAICSPSDGKLLVVEHLSSLSAFPIKGVLFNYEQLLGKGFLKVFDEEERTTRKAVQKKNKKEGRVFTNKKNKKVEKFKNSFTDSCSMDIDYYKNGTAFIIRLSPGDYHRFHMPIAGTPQRCYSIPGFFDSVDPFVYSTGKQPLLGNQRVVFEIDTIYGFRIAMIAVGALCVGRIVTTYVPGTCAKKGDDIGYFSFGGSTIVILFPAGYIRIAEKYRIRSMQGKESVVLAGNRIAQMC